MGRSRTNPASGALASEGAGLRLSRILRRIAGRIAARFRTRSRFDPASIGRHGEKLACRYLKKRGCKILSRNHRCPAGEIDLIALDGRTIAFVEVKSRWGIEHADPEETVTLHKRRQLHRVARHWLSQHRADDRTCRFDVVAVMFLDNGEPVIRYTADAFEPPKC